MDRSMNSSPIAIIKVGETFPQICDQHGDFEHWTRDCLCGEASPLGTIVIDPRSTGHLPEVTAFSGIVVTGSHEMITEEAEWMRGLSLWLRLAVAYEVPTLGICFGHHALAQAFGGTVGYRTSGPEIGTAEITTTEAASDDVLFGTLPPAFRAQVVHWQSVLTLPQDAVLLARSEGDPHQAFRVGSSAWGIQFHPEISEFIVRRYIELLAPRLSFEGQDVDQLKAGIAATPLAGAVLRNFHDHAVALDGGRG